MGELIYGGLWFTPLREALSAFVDSTQETVSGTVRLKLDKGSISAAGVSSPYSLYNASIASFTTGELYNHADAKGFIRLYGLPVLVRALMQSGQKPAQQAPQKFGVKPGKPVPLKPEKQDSGGKPGPGAKSKKVKEK
jgi:argininosuccinate synthase